MASFVIRRAGESDAAALCAYVDELLAEKLDTITLEKSFSLEDEIAFLRKANTAERAFFLIALDGERVIGMLDLWAGDRASTRHAGRFGMSTARDRRGKGVGRALLERAIAETRAWDGFCRIELDVTAWNTPAISLYESLGFVTEGRLRKSVSLRGEPEDVLRMALVW